MNNTDKDIITNFKENNYLAISFQLIEYILGMFIVMMGLYTLQINYIQHTDVFEQLQWVIIALFMLLRGIHMITTQFENYYYEEEVSLENNLK